MPKLYFIVFIVIALSLYGAMHWFIYQRIANGLSLTSGPRLALKIFMLAAALSFILAEFLSRLKLFNSLRLVGSLWLGIIAISLAVFFLETISSLLFPGSRRYLVIAALLVISMISGFSIFNGQRYPRVREITVPIPGLRPDLSGFSIIHLSDLHLGNLTPLKRLKWTVERVNSLEPDLICVTGDVLDRDIGQSGEYCQLLMELKARHGVVAVTGNHEFYAGLDLFSDLARKCGWRILRNQACDIDGKLCLIGLDDDAGKNFKFSGPDLDEALRSAAKDVPRILLYHRPDGFARAAREGIDLQLSGHTHAGQIPPMDFLVWLIYKYPSGFYSLGHAHIHTSAGTSTWGPPMRFLSRSEIVKLTLVSQ
ncbi:MAG: metallophosphoesterase [Candidatus Aminicenantes bacterium]|nr:metallophosphoesterase [Candidatus Aminicenantes bacterium]